MNPNDPLDSLLRRAGGEPRLPARFQSEVWQRIADRETASPWTPLRRWLEEMAFLLTRPRYATALLAVVVLASAGLAQWRGSYDGQETRLAMQDRYVNSIDPYARMNR